MTKTITSRDNRKLAHARKVRDGRVRSSIFIEGKRLVEEALRSPLVFEHCFVEEGSAGDDILKRVAAAGVEIAELPEKVFASVAGTGHSQGVILIAQRPHASLDAVADRLRSAAVQLVVYLHEVNNPSNLGAVIRTAEAAGVAGVIVSPDSADAFSAKAVRAAMGSSFRLPVVERIDLDGALAFARAHKMTSTAADVSAKASYADIDWHRPRLLILGSEAHGLADTDLERVDEILRIPMENDVESLNLAVSAGVILFEAKRRRCEN